MLSNGAAALRINAEKSKAILTLEMIVKSVLNYLEPLILVPLVNHRDRREIKNLSAADLP